jgi:hypothetical protein
MPTCSYRPAAQLRQALLDGAELALIDVREEADFARSHPLFAANLPLSKLELDIFRRVPRLTTPITVYDGGEGWRSGPLNACRAGATKMSPCWKAACRAGSAAAGTVSGRQFAEQSVRRAGGERAAYPFAERRGSESAAR